MGNIPDKPTGNSPQVFNPDQFNEDYFIHPPPTNEFHVNQNKKEFDKAVAYKPQQDLNTVMNVIKSSEESLREIRVPQKSIILDIPQKGFIPIKVSSIYETESMKNKFDDSLKIEIQKRLKKSKFESHLKDTYNIVSTPEYFDYEIIDINKTKRQSRTNKFLIYKENEWKEHEKLVKQNLENDFNTRIKSLKKRPREESTETDQGPPESSKSKKQRVNKSKDVVLPPTVVQLTPPIEQPNVQPVSINPKPTINVFKNSEYLLKTSPEFKNKLFEDINDYSIHKSSKNQNSHQSIYQVNFDSSISPWRENWKTVAVPFFKKDSSYTYTINKKYKLISKTLSTGQTSTGSYVFITIFQDTGKFMIENFKKLFFGTTSLRLVSKIINITSRFSKTSGKFIDRDYNIVNPEMFDILNEIKVSYFLNILLFGFDTILSPNFMINIDWFQIKWKYFLPENSWTISQFVAQEEDTVQVLVSEILDQDLKSFLNKQNLLSITRNRKDQWKILQFCLFETFHFLETAFLVTGFISFDFHITNCMLNYYPDWKEKTLIYERFKRKGMTYAINPIYHKGNLIKIFDFGRSRIYPRLKNMELTKDQMKLIYHDLHDESFNINEKENLFIDTRVFIGSLCLQLGEDYWKFVKESVSGDEWKNIITIFDNTLGLDNWRNNFVKKYSENKLENAFKIYFPIKSIDDFSCLHLMNFIFTEGNKNDVVKLVNEYLLFVKPFEGQSGMSATNLLDSILFEDLKIDPENENQYIYLSRPNDDWILK